MYKFSPMPTDLSISFGNIYIPSQHLEGGGFTSTIHPQQSKALALWYANTQVIYSFHLAFLAWSPVNLKNMLGESI